MWIGSGRPLGYSNWHPYAAPDLAGYNCVEMLSGTAYEVEFDTDNIISIVSVMFPTRGSG